MAAMENNPQDDEDYLMMCHLPKEILSCIFAILRLDDRKNVRLVCRLWYHCSTILSITKNEKFVFRIHSNVEDVAEVMMKSSSSLCLNLEFQGLPMINLPINFWNECGPRIHSLEFFECDINDETIKNIIIYCENMISFVLRTWNHNFAKKLLRSSIFLDKLVEKGIVRTKLRTFNIFINDYKTGRDGVVIDKIFLIYPGIRHFTAENISKDSFSCIPISLDSLSLFASEAGEVKNLMEVCVAKAEQGLRLKRFEARLHTYGESRLMYKRLFKFFSSQEKLNVINLELQGCCRREDNNDEEYCFHVKNIKKIIFHILKSSPNLREFRFSSFYPIKICSEWEELYQFFALTSKLQFLDINFYYVSASLSMSKAVKSLQFPANLALTTLELCYRLNRMREHIYAVLLPHCPRLLHFRVRLNTDHTLQTIFKYLLELRTLILIVDGSCSDYGFTGHDASRKDGYSIKRLQQLKYLNIHGLKKMHFIGKIFLEFQFPRLEFLEIDIGLDKLPVEVLERFPSQVSELRIFIFGDRCRNVCLQEIIQFCKYCSKIVHFSIFGKRADCTFHTLVHEQIEEIFNVCPSLRYFSNRHEKNSTVFFFDPFTKKVLKMKNVFILKFQYNNIFAKDFFDLDI